MAITKKKKLEKELLRKQKAALQAEIGRRKLLQAIVARREGKPVSVLRRIEDKIPNVLIKTRAEEIKPTFLGKGRI